MTGCGTPCPVLVSAVRVDPDALALDDGRGGRWTFAALDACVAALAAELVERDVRRVAWLADNGPTPILLELAALSAGVTTVPVPAFFTDDMLAHALEVSRPDLIVTDAADRWRSLDPRLVAVRGLTGLPETVLCLPASASGRDRRPAREAATLTFTSGTTGRPKGMLVPAELRLTVARSLGDALQTSPRDRHLCLLPLSVMLEVVGGVFRTLLAGAPVVVPPLADVGLRGSQQVTPARLVGALSIHRPRVAITVPATLQALVEELDATDSVVESLRFLGVGGAPVSRAWIERARAHGVPAFEGYGLTEAGSVVSLNLPGADRPGSSGRPLPHASVRVDSAGEILLTLPAGVRRADEALDPVAGPGTTTEVATGDVGALDADGFLHVHGRLGARIVTPFGRNVSPEWVERTLREEAWIAEARVTLQDGVLVADIVPRDPDPDGNPDPDRDADPRTRVEAAVRRANATLPDYARVGRFELLADLLTDLPRSTVGGEPASAPRVPPPVGLERPALVRQGAPPTRVSFHQTLLEHTRGESAALFEIPFVAAAVTGALSLAEYQRFLAQAYHHVKHTVPLLMATGVALRGRHPWLRAAIVEYIGEEVGHEDWILDDIAASGGDADAVRHGRPDLPCELLVAYAYDLVGRGDPLGFFGMVHVLEGTSVRGATRAAEALRERLGLPLSALRYLSSHGALDVGHSETFGRLMDRIDDPREQRSILHAARVFFRLYGDVFRALPVQAGRAAPLETGP